MVAFRADFYTSAHPVAPDVLLLLEIADTNLLFDRRVKVPLYARAGVREAWLVDLTSDRLKSVVPEAFPDLTITVADLIG